MGEAFGVGERSAEVERPLDRVLARLVPADALGLSDVANSTDRAEDVEHLPDVELDAQLVPHPPGSRVGGLEQPIGVDEGEVADQDRDPLAEPPRLAGPFVLGVDVAEDVVGGRLTATAGGIVHHVVVEQRERVHQLERGAGIDHDRIGRIAPGADETPVAERRPEPLAP